MATPDAERRTGNQRPGHHRPGFGQHPAEGMAGNAHDGGGGFGRQAFAVGQTQGLQPFDGQAQFGQLAQGNARGLVVGGPGQGIHPTAQSGAGHERTPFVSLN